jgi:RNA polymerase sigma factor (sigma-70 family)
MGQNADAPSPAPQTDADYGDSYLLRRYVRHGSQAAFAALVRRYGGLVHAACLREVNDKQLAEDVTQVVFLLLARRAPSLLRVECLAGWLFRAAQFSARNALRQERRRKVHEQEVIADMTQAHMNGPPIPTWSLLEPLINAALASLRPHEQEVVLLRYLEGASWRETAARLGLAEDTAQKRGTRAVDKMRRFVNRQGLVLSVAALTALLSEEAARAAPLPAAVVAQTTAGIAGHSGLVSPNVASLYGGLLHTMKLTKIAATLGGLALAGTVGGILWAQSAPKPQTPLQLLGQVRTHYQSLTSFSMQIEHQDDSGLYPGRYTQKLQWRRGGRFVLRVTAQDNPKVSDFTANGRQISSVFDGHHFVTPLAVSPNDMPGWEVSGGEIMGWLQDTPASGFLFSPPPGMTFTWSFGPRTVWHGFKVRELQGHITNQGRVEIISLFIDRQSPLCLGHEGPGLGGKAVGYALYTNQKENPPLPTTLGSAP